MMPGERPDFLVGVLADDTYVQERTGSKAAVFVNSLQVVQYAIRPICRLPQGLQGVRLFHGFSKDLERHGLLDDYAAAAEERIQGLRNFLASQLLVFRPSQKGQYWNVVDACPVAAPLAHQADSVYAPLPFLSLEEDGLSLSLLMQRLLERKPLPGMAHLSAESADTPPCLLWQVGKQASTPWHVIGSFIGHQYGEMGCELRSEGELRTIQFQESWESGVFEAPNNPHLLFVNEQVQTLMRQALEQAAPYQQFSDVSAAEADNLPLSAPTTLAVTNNQPEIEFLHRLQQAAVSQGLLYSAAELVNFHTAMKTSGLVILTGLSGTGKSRLVRLYGQALGLADEQFSFIPVRPAWTDDSDLIGFLDQAHSLYRPGESGLLRTLIQAARDPERLYLICLDEMNLARVEHYFSQLLSVLELPLGERRLRLYPDELVGKLHNSLQYPPTVPLWDNLLFAGTVNLDESTYHFSDKVLDRANVIHLDVKQFDELLRLRPGELEVCLEITTAAWRNFRVGTPGPALCEREIALLWQLHQEMQLSSAALGIGYRIVLQIGRYLQNLPQSGVLSRADALDRQLLQRVFTKIRGPESQLLALVGVSSGEAAGGSRLLALLDQFSDLSPFLLCRQALRQKGRDLAQHGYTV